MSGLISNNLQFSCFVDFNLNKSMQRAYFCSTFNLQGQKYAELDKLVMKFLCHFKFFETSWVILNFSAELKSPKDLRQAQYYVYA